MAQLTFDQALWVVNMTCSAQSKTVEAIALLNKILSAFTAKTASVVFRIVFIRREFELLDAILTDLQDTEQDSESWYDKLLAERNEEEAELSIIPSARTCLLCGT